LAQGLAPQLSALGLALAFEKLDQALELAAVRVNLGQALCRSGVCWVLVEHPFVQVASSPRIVQLVLQNLGDFDT
jgi:hypothetical protein